MKYKVEYSLAYVVRKVGETVCNHTFNSFENMENFILDEIKRQEKLKK